MWRFTILPLVCAQTLLFAQSTGKITGKVTDAATHQPIPKVHVSCTTNSQGFVGTLTGVDGSYTLEDVPAGRVRMTVNLDGYRLIIDAPDRSAGPRNGPDTNGGFPLAAGETATHNFEMHPLGRIYGKLVDRATGKPIALHTVSAVRKEYQPGEVFSIQRAGEQKTGEFDIGNLEPADYLLQIDPLEQGKIVFNADEPSKPIAEKCYGHAWYPDVPRADMAAAIHLGEGESRRVDISLESREMHSLSGTIKSPREFEGQPVTLAIQSSGANLRNGAAAAMPTPGRFRIESLAPGSYRLSVTAGKLPNNVQTFADYIDAEAFSLGIAVPMAAADYEFEIASRDIDNFKVALTPYASVSGEVRMLEKDAKLPEKLAFAMWPATEAPILIRGNAVEAGRFRQDGLRPGEYWPQLSRLPDGYAIAQIQFDGASPRKSTLTLSAPDTPVTIVITSRPGAIAGMVRNEDQSPAPGAMVVLLPDTLPDKPARETIQVQKTGRDGAFLFKNLAPGKYRAFVLPLADAADQGDIGHLRERAAHVEVTEVQPAQTATLNLKQ